MKRVGYIAAAVSILALVGCGTPQSKQSSAPPQNPPAPAILAKITVTPAPVSILVGSTQVLQATAIDQFGRLFAVSKYNWTSDNPNVVTVSDGTASGRSAGTANVTASSGQVTSINDVITAVVTPPPTGPPPTSLAETWRGVISAPGYPDGTFSIPMVKGWLCTSGNNPDGCYQSDNWADPQDGSFCLLMGVYGLTAEVNLDGTIAFTLVEKGGDGLWVTYFGVLPPLELSGNGSLTTSGAWNTDPASDQCYPPRLWSEWLSLFVSYSDTHWLRT